MINKIKASTKLYLLVFIMSFFIIGIGVYGIGEMHRMNENTKTIYNDRVFPLQQLTSVRFSYSIGILSSAEQAINHQISFDDATKEIEKAQGKIASNWKA